MKISKAVCIYTVLFLTCNLSWAQLNVHSTLPSSTKPVFQVDTPFPTTDKPQSKIWYMDDCWWALLPKAAGPSLWQRTGQGWTEHKEITEALRGIPGRADVWAKDHEVMAVGVGEHSLTVFRLERLKNGGTIQWKAHVLTKLTPVPAQEDIETATIAQDDSGRWWVAADAGNKICVWSSADGKQWTGAIELSDGINKDDICTVTPLPEGVGVIWSDQNRDGVYMRIHRNGSPAESWSETTTIEQGNKTADDHLRAALSADGTLWLATKNSVDKVGQPQLVLRVRTSDGKWNNLPYAMLNSTKLPSRPIIVTTDDPSIVLSGYTIYNHQNPFLGEILFGQIDTTQADILTNVRTIISPDTTGWTGKNLVNDITGPKKPFAMNAPWIVLASDGYGNVYEADLRKIFSNKPGENHIK